MAKGGGEQSHENIEKGVHITNYVLSQHPAFESCNNSSTSNCSLEVDLESGVPEILVNNPTKADKNSRICHLSLDGTPESGIPIDLGCSCKHDLASGHKQCAETWFKIKGNKICEICGSMAKNDVCVTETKVLDQLNETANDAPTAPNWRVLLWKSFINGLYVEMILNFTFWFSRGDRMYLFLSFVFFFFIIVCECVDCRRTENPSITPQQQQAD